MSTDLVNCKTCFTFSTDYCSFMGICHILPLTHISSGQEKQMCAPSLPLPGCFGCHWRNVKQIPWLQCQAFHNIWFILEANIMNRLTSSLWMCPNEHCLLVPCTLNIHLQKSLFIQFVPTVVLHEMRLASLYKVCETRRKYSSMGCVWGRGTDGCEHSDYTDTRVLDLLALCNCLDTAAQTAAGCIHCLHNSSIVFSFISVWRGKTIIRGLVATSKIRMSSFRFSTP